MAVVIEEPTFFENILHYGLLLGAAFQLVCIFAVIFIPKSESEMEVDSAEQAVGARATAASARQDQTARRNKKEKKKHR